MKKHFLQRLSSVFRTATFGQAMFDFEDSGDQLYVPDESSLELNSADDTMSGPVDIDVQYDPLENGDNIDNVFNSADDVFDIDNATEVETGPAMNIVLLLSVLALSGIITYRVRRSQL